MRRSTTSLHLLFRTNGDDDDRAPSDSISISVPSGSISISVPSDSISISVFRSDDLPCILFQFTILSSPPASLPTQ